MRHRAWTASIFTSLMLIAAGCGKPPEKALADAEQALLDASARKKCAREKYDAAEKLLAQAKALVEEKEYDEAERKALAAKKLAEQAKNEADLTWEQCNRKEKAVAEAKEEPEQNKDELEELVLSTVYFGYDSAELTTEQRQTLDQNAAWMRQNTPTRIVLEGHTDERGSVEYNLALGERRAGAVRQYLLQLGVDEGRLRMISYGEEKPASLGASDNDYRQNRRVEFMPKGE